MNGTLIWWWWWWWYRLCWSLCEFREPLLLIDRSIRSLKMYYIHFVLRGNKDLTHCPLILGSLKAAGQTLAAAGGEKLAGKRAEQHYLCVLSFLSQQTTWCRSSALTLKGRRDNGALNNGLVGKKQACDYCMSAAGRVGHVYRG